MTATTTTKFLLIRHAEHGLLDRVLAGRMPDVSLSDAGRTQSERLAVRVLGEFAPLAAVYHGPLERARQTAGPLAERCGLPVRVAPELEEVNFGEWTGRTFTDLARDERWHAWNRHRATAGTPGGETIAAVRARVATGFTRWESAYRGGTVALVSHCEILRVALLDALGMNHDDFWRLEISPASLSVLTVDGDGVQRVLRVNDTTALRP